jgi:hypothetical protein
VSSTQAQDALRVLAREGLVVPPVGTTDLARCTRTIIESDEPVYAWLPQTVLHGADGDVVAPLQLLREAGDVLTLRLFVECYAHQDLPNVGGLPVRVLSATWDTHVILRSASWCVVAFAQESQRTHLARTDALVAPYADPLADGHAWAAPWFAHLNRLCGMGLLTDVLRLAVAGDGEAAAFTFWPSRWRGPHDVPAEVTTGQILDETWPVMLHRQHEARSAIDALAEAGTPVLVVPVPSHMVERATLQTIYRLRYRAHTADTAVWLQGLAQQAAHWQQRFRTATLQWGGVASAGGSATAHRVAHGVGES